MTRLDELRAKAAAKREAAEAARLELAEVETELRRALAADRTDDDRLYLLAGIRETLKWMRLDCGLSQGDVATRMGVAQSAVSKIEAGENQPTLERLEAWAHACGRDVFLVFPKREGA